MSKAAERTGAGPMFAVAVEQYFPREKRLIEDDLAASVIPPPVRYLLPLMRPPFMRNRVVRELEASSPGLWAGVMCRKRYIDDCLAETVAEVEGVINHGCGFDTRAYRLPALRGKPVWEIDQPQNIKSKRAALQRRMGALPGNVHLVPIDFDRQDAADVLTEHDCSLSARNIHVAEAILQYLTPQGVTSLFDVLSRTAPGSRLIFTYVVKDFIDGTRRYDHQRLYEEWIVKKKAWLFGLHPSEVGEFLASHGWELIEDVGYDELADRYIVPTGRNLASMPIERMVHARKV